MFKFDTMRFIKVVNYPYYFWHRYILNPDFFRGAEVVKTFNYSRAIMQFCYAMAKKDLLSDCPIDQNSVVLDIGGHTGEWAEKIVNKYDPFMHIFEPLPPSFEKLEKKFQHKEKVHMYSFGVADQNRTATLSMYGKGSSIYSDCPSYSINPNTIDVSLKDIYEIVESHKFNFVDLIKINIEGGEYPLIERILDSNIIDRFGTIWVQFHEWYPRARYLRRKIIKSLLKTHYVEWSYPFVWESFQRKEGR